ncbi:YIP1 family protein [Candidatus Woesearchaeota archaeon]|nr:YIP1 family protein [Candidatus Woesearchaeota archaeon]
MNFFNKIRNILLEPSKFFLNTEKEKGVKESFIFVSVLTFFYSIMGLILLVLFKDSITNFFLNLLNLPTTQFDLPKTIIAVLLSIPFSILFTFVSAAILYVWLMIFKGEKDYQTAYKLLVYSRTPNLLFGWIPIINWFSWIYSLILLIIGTHVIYKFSKLKTTLIYIIPLALITILLGILFLMLFLILATQTGQVPQSF